MNSKLFLSFLMMIFSQSLLAEKPSNELITREPASISTIQKNNQMKQKDVEKIRELKKDIQKIMLKNKI
jgi:hypothetical protein